MLHGCLKNWRVEVYLFFYHSVVGDNLDRLAAVFQTAANRSDIVFITGGLGPTEDDLTREAFQKNDWLKNCRG